MFLHPDRVGPSKECFKGYLPRHSTGVKIFVLIYRTKFSTRTVTFLDYNFLEKYKWYGFSRTTVFLCES